MSRRTAIFDNAASLSLAGSGEVVDGLWMVEALGVNAVRLRHVTSGHVVVLVLN